MFLIRKLLSNWREHQATGQRALAEYEEPIDKYKSFSLDYNNGISPRCMAHLGEDRLQRKVIHPLLLACGETLNRPKTLDYYVICYLGQFLLVTKNGTQESTENCQSWILMISMSSIVYDPADYIFHWFQVGWKYSGIETTLKFIFKINLPFVSKFCYLQNYPWCI